VCGGSESPVTFAPSPFSHNTNHAPLNPVWPVTKTRRSRQKLASKANIKMAR
jgi:hypothetical protein